MTYTSAQKIEYSKKRLIQNRYQARGVVTALESIDYNKSYKISSCAARLDVQVIGDNIKMKTWYCKQHKLCPTCNKIRAYKLTEKLNAKILNAGIEHLHTKHLVLTIKNSKQLPDRFKYMTACKEKLRRLRGRGKVSEWSNVVAAFGSIELSVNTANQYHVHIHMVTYSHDELDYHLLQNEWQDIAGEGSHINDWTIAGIDHMKVIATYINKLPNVDTDNAIRWDNITHGRHLFFTWGSVRGSLPNQPKRTNEPTANAEYFCLEWSDEIGDYVDVETTNYGDIDTPDFPDTITLH